jgi:hypothetical protein
MIRARIGMLVALSMLSVAGPASAQRLLPLDRPVVAPPVSDRQVREAERVRPSRANDARWPRATAAGRDNPGLDYDVTSALQQRQLDSVVPPRRP